MDYPVVLLGIVKDGQGSKFLQACKDGGSTGGTVLRGLGTIGNKVMNILGLHDRRNEVILTIVPNELEDSLHQLISKRLHMDKHGQGVLFSLAATSLIGNHGKDYQFQESEENMADHQVIITIVDREFGDDVVAAGREAGARGATILHGRGKGSREVSKLFHVNIEPEKEVVLMVVDGDKTKTISDNIVKELDIRAKGKGLLFTMGVNQTTGLYEAD